MLELLHKVDQRKEQNLASHFSSSDGNRMSGVAFPRPVGLKRSYPFNARGSNLQLASPSQGVGASDPCAASQHASRHVEPPSSFDLASDKEDNDHAWLNPVSSAQCLPPSHPGVQVAVT